MDAQLSSGRLKGPWPSRRVVSAASFPSSLPLTVCWIGSDIDVQGAAGLAAAEDGLDEVALDVPVEGRLVEEGSQVGTHHAGIGEVAHVGHGGEVGGERDEVDAADTARGTARRDLHQAVGCLLGVGDGDIRVWGKEGG